MRFQHMILHFFVHEQTVTALETTSVPRYGSRGYLRLAFEFGESWDAFPAANGGRTVYLQKGEISAPVVLDESGCVEVDDYFTATGDGFMLMLVGVNGTVVCPTNVLSVSLAPSGEAWTAEPPDLDIPAYQQLVLLAQKAVEAAEEARQLAYCLPIARGQSEDGVAYVAAGENLPGVNPGSNRDHAGKGKQIIFIPDHSSNTIESPTLQINGGDAVPIRMRAPKNQGQDESSPDATLPVPVGALMVGVPYTLTFCGKYWLVDSQIAEEAAKAVAVTDFNITRGSGHYTATWKDAGTQKSANIVGGVGLAQVTEILSYDISTRLPKLLKSKLVGAPMYSVMIGDLIVYTGADFTVSVPSEEAGGVAKVTIAERNEVFRVVTVTEGGSEHEGYIVERTGLILKDSQISATLDGTDVATVRDALAYLQDLAKQYVVNMTKNADGTYSADKTFDALKAAHDAGKTVICSFRDLTRQWDGQVRLPLVYLGNTYMGFAAVVNQEQGNMVYLWAYINSGGMGHSATEIATNDTVSTMIAAAMGDTATALSDMDSVIGGAGA